MSKYVENQYDILPKSTLAARFEDCGRILSLLQMTPRRVHQTVFWTKLDDTFCISTYPSVCHSSLGTHIIKKVVTEYIAPPNQDLAKKVVLCENCGDKFVWIALLDCTSWRKTEPSNQVVYTHCTDWLHCQNFFLSRNSVQSSTNNRSFTCYTWNPVIIFSMHGSLVQVQD